MLFRKDPRKQAVLELAMKQVEKFLRDMQDDGADLTRLKFKKYQKTHFTTCTCPQCREAERKRNPHLRGLQEEGYKVYVGEGAGEE
jgi:queuine/archaeosine tRNA-ribosyltransferase